MKPIWTIGREREKLHAAKFVRGADQQALLFPVIDAVHDLNEGEIDTDRFVTAARTAMIEGAFGVWANTNNWIRKIGNRHPNVLPLWDELSEHTSWKVRWRVACCLYSDIGDAQSDRIFSVLRNDKSKKVREYAIDRYEKRPDDKGRVEKRFDARKFDERIRSSEVII